MQSIGPDVLDKRADKRKVIHVAVAVILGEDGRILLARRPENKHMGGLWEFPGGKVESGEDVQTALNRELHEELDIQVSTFMPLIKVRHDYSDKSVLLDTWVVGGITGEPKGNEGQLIQWVEKQSLVRYQFPEANKVILRALQLPDRYMITGYFNDEETLFKKVSSALSAGVRLIQFRAHWLDESEYLKLARRLSKRVQTQGGTLIIKGRLSLLMEPWCHGLHLTSHQLGLAVTPERRHADQLLVASCHDEKQIKYSEVMTVDFITVSPVKPTQSHPGAKPLGMDQAAKLTETATVPVFWLGGMSLDDIKGARRLGAQGVAAIHEFWGC
ncbi:Nudix family hydrolase [Endozoicomonas sp.]|uniref:Nudix family hydrolase n=1 Tax=Endozoicomonas sp. TaxID=1892382 RepID=UPI002886680B|nr:Nudix family hydrolase [Endozoicomonas sp.]